MTEKEREIPKNKKPFRCRNTAAFYGLVYGSLSNGIFLFSAEYSVCGQKYSQINLPLIVYSGDVSNSATNSHHHWTQNDILQLDTIETNYFIFENFNEINEINENNVDVMTLKN